MKPGDPVEVTVDTYPGRAWKGEVEAIAPNSGSEFSVLPAQNTSGNWVKVVQRIPVRIKVEHNDGDPELRAGMSVVADIDTGHRRSWRDLYWPMTSTQPAKTQASAISPIATAAEQVPHRYLIITLCTVGATLMQALDQTIANVALPYMQGSLSATYDEITWVLTSYITAAAIMTAPVGWLASRFGRKYLFITCLVGFTVTSMMCGAAQSLAQMVVFRLLQGMFGAALVPLSQSTMMDIYPVEQRGKAMAIWGVGVMVGPILGPTLGGYLTEMYNWRYVFYINLPFGILATLGLAFFMPRSFGNFNLRFDWIGFGVLSLGIGGLQMMLDRGQDQDWFTSTEVIAEAVLGGLGRLSVHRPHDHGEEAVHSGGSVQGPKFLGRAGADVRDRDDPGIQFVADGAVAAESGELPGGDGRPDHGAARHRHDGGDDDRRAACRQDRTRAS